MKERMAYCCCGDLSITVSGDPERVLACHCDYCQRRTGNIMQVSCWFFEDQVISQTGDYEVYQGPDNNGVEYRFCPTCGSTVYWLFTFLKDLVDVPVFGIAVGCFAEPDFPIPDLEIWTDKKHHWLDKVDGADHYQEFPPPERLVPDRQKHV